MIKSDLCELTRQLFFTCLGGQNPGKVREIADIFKENPIVIGSREQEYYTSAEQFKSGLESGRWRNGREYVYRPVKEWFQSIRLSENVYLVCGNVRIEKIFQSHRPEMGTEAAGPSFTGLTETSVRISLIWKKEEKADKIVHMHISVPGDEESDSLVEAEKRTGEEDAVRTGTENKTIDYYRNLSEKDQMTGLYNRGSFEYYVKELLKSKEGGTFYMIDLDDFKAVNDTYGHVAGDRVILEMADILRRVFAGQAVIGRLGGDEFAVYETDCCRKSAEEKAGKVLEAYSALSGKYGSECTLSCSIGLYREADGETFENLYSRADEALYYSKNSYKGTFHWYYSQHRI